MAKILVIDDDATFRQLVSIALGAWGHTIVEAPRLRAAETILEGERPDLVLIDGLLPDGDGASWIAKRRKSLGAPYIFVSAFWKGARDVRQLQADAMPAGFLRKPTTSEAIAAEVERVLGITVPCNGPPASDVEGMEALRVEYCAELPQRLAQIRMTLDKLRLRPRDAVLLAETRRQVHELAGTAGTFGFDELTAIGVRLEKALLDLRAANGPSPAWSQIVAGRGAIVDWEARLSRPRVPDNAGVAAA